MDLLLLMLLLMLRFIFLLMLLLLLLLLLQTINASPITSSCSECMVQVAAEAFSRQPPAARPRSVRRRPTLDSKQPKLPAAPSAEVHPPEQQQVW